MIQAFVDRFMGNEQAIRSELAAAHPGEYKDIVRMVVENISGGGFGTPDPERIHVIDDGDYQGTLVFVVGETGYQPGDYWYVRVGYGSCSGCDALEDIRAYSVHPPTPEQVDDYWTLALHIVQGFAAMRCE